MNDLPEDRGPEMGGADVPDAWREFDDTLADGPSPASVPDQARVWLGDQRFMHGLLRALHTADAAGREGRIAQLLERIDSESAGAERGAPAVGAPRRAFAYWASVSLAAMLFAAAMLWWSLPASLPTADAAVSRAVAELSRDLNRRFHLEMLGTDRTGKVMMRNEFALVTQPGNRFRIDGKLAFGNLQFGELRIGCDGSELWVLPANGLFRKAVPLSERERLMKGFGDVLDLGYLDVHELVEKLPNDFDLRVVGRETGTDGRSLLRIEATRRAGAKGKLKSAWLLCDEASGMVTRIEAEVDMGAGFGRKFTLQYLGEESPGLVDYKRPW